VLAFEMIASPKNKKKVKRKVAVLCVFNLSNKNGGKVVKANISSYLSSKFGKRRKSKIKKKTFLN